MPAPHHSVFFQAGCPFCRPTNSVKALKVAISNSKVNRARLRIIHTVSISERSVDGNGNAGPHAHISGIGMGLDQGAAGVGDQFPVHAARDDVGAPVVSPDERRVETVDVPRQTGVGERPTGNGVALTARQLPVTGTCTPPMTNKRRSTEKLQFPVLLFHQVVQKH